MAALDEPAQQSWSSSGAGDFRRDAHAPGRTRAAPGIDSDRGGSPPSPRDRRLGVPRQWRGQPCGDRAGMAGGPPAGDDAPARRRHAGSDAQRALGVLLSPRRGPHRGDAAGRSTFPTIRPRRGRANDHRANPLARIRLDRTLARRGSVAQRELASRPEIAANNAPARRTQSARQRVPDTPAAKAPAEAPPGRPLDDTPSFTEDGGIVFPTSNPNFSRVLSPVTVGQWKRWAARTRSIHERSIASENQSPSQADTPAGQIGPPSQTSPGVQGSPSQQAAATESPQAASGSESEPTAAGKPVATVSEPSLEKALADAWGLIERDEYDLGRRILLEARKAGKEDIRIDFSLGLASALGTHDWPAAEKHFAECVRQGPQDVPSLNNLALARLRVHWDKQSLKPWETALAQGPPPPEIVQNLGRLRYLIKAGQLADEPALTEAIERLYMMATLAAGQSVERQVGFLYMGLKLTENRTVGWSDGKKHEERMVHCLRWGGPCAVPEPGLRARDSPAAEIAGRRPVGVRSLPRKWVGSVHRVCPGQGQGAQAVVHLARECASQQHAAGHILSYEKHDMMRPLLVGDLYWSVEFWCPSFQP